MILPNFCQTLPDHIASPHGNSIGKAIEQYRKVGQLPSIDICDKGYQDFNFIHLLITHRTYDHFSTEIYKNFRIINIDTSLLSLDDNDIGQLSVFFPELAKLEIEKDDKINIVIMHHGVEFLRPEDGRKFQHWLVHTAAASGRWCGAERPLCGLSNSRH